MEKIDSAITSRANQLNTFKNIFLNDVRIKVDLLAMVKQDCAVKIVGLHFFFYT